MVGAPRSRCGAGYAAPRTPAAAAGPEPGDRAPGGREAAAPALALAAALALAGCAREPAAEAPAPAPARRLNVVLILVDTLRADHLSAYGYGRPTSPNLDAFAASGVLFERAWSQATCTFPAANAILTSRYPAVFLGQPEGRMGIPEGIASLAEILRGRGYTTVALSASPIVRKSPSRFNPHGGFERGFDFFGEGCIWKEARCLEDRVARQLPVLRRPFFLYLHYMDPHSPYRPPPDHPRRFAGEYDGALESIRRGDPNPIAAMLYKGGGRVDFTPADVAHLVDLYDDAVGFFDQRLPRLLALLDGDGAGEETIVALVSDHGEEFLEHGDIKHCRAPYGTQVEVPMILRVPGGPAGVRVAAAVETIDLVPTLLDYLGEDLAAHRFEGRSLRPLIEGRAAAGEVGRAAFSSQGPWRAVTDGRFKLMVRLREPRAVHLFDLAQDPGELDDVQRQHPEVLHRLRRALYEWIERTEGSPEAGLEAAEEAERRLKALGYLQ